MQDMVVGSPWEKVGMDLAGRYCAPDVVTNYILTYQDHFTKFAEAYHIPNKETECSS